MQSSSWLEGGRRRYHQPMKWQQRLPPTFYGGQNKKILPPTAELIINLFCPIMLTDRILSMYESVTMDPADDIFTSMVHPGDDAAIAKWLSRTNLPEAIETSRRIAKTDINAAPVLDVARGVLVRPMTAAEFLRATECALIYKCWVNSPIIN